MNPASIKPGSVLRNLIEAEKDELSALLVRIERLRHTLAEAEHHADELRDSIRRRELA